MAAPTGEPNPADQRRIEELRQHLEELVDEMAFYQMRWDSLAKEGTPDATRELQFFAEGFSELEAEAMDLRNQLHELEYKSGGVQTAATSLDRTEENRDLVTLQKEELECIEKLAKLQDEGAEEQIKQLRNKLNYLRREIEQIYDHH
ncbi:MAG: hypothetical protein S4CHLAM81_06150 [Chlamydiales bacterium]|nr:hypothetical protein [Chlamydiales bacterium]MCH9635399.1 hypothetical protein [Chlamydiales bacterium]MCH9704297.1 hypothetical protein [Chlamydiota bacterium]